MNRYLILSPEGHHMDVEITAASISLDDPRGHARFSDDDGKTLALAAEGTWRVIIKRGAEDPLGHVLVSILRDHLDRALYQLRMPHISKAQGEIAAALAKLPQAQRDA